MKKLKKIPTKKWFYPALIISIIATGTIARLSFLTFEYNPQWDPGTFYWNAQSLSQTGELQQGTNGTTGITHQTYFAMYPYEMNYTGLLALTNLIFGNSYFSVIILNLIFDLLGATLAFLTIKTLLPKQKYPPLLAAAFYFLNPLNVVFSALSLPIIVVNALITLAIFIVIKFLKKGTANYKTPRLLALFATLGITLAIGNGFRPIFIIILIAITLLLIYLIISKQIHGKTPITRIICAALLMITSYFATTQLNFALVDHYAKIPAARSASGWSLYLGSNIDYSGKWAYDSPDQTVRSNLWQKHPTDMQAVHNELTRLALARYQQNGIAGNLNLYINKALIASGDQANSTYNIASSLVNYPETTQKITSEITKIFTLALAALLLINIAKNWGKTHTNIWIFLTLIIVGFFLSCLLVEVKNRYFTILLPPLILLTAYHPTRPKPKNML